MKAELIEKEEVVNLKFLDAPKGEVTVEAEKLNGAVRLGNEFKSKAYITFQTDQGPKKIETTVWSVTESFLQIKNDVLIPIKSLIDIQY
ncbi:hypothetical protein SAMN05443634_1177 [Chishuiella changwenlii]|jgi:hypothetical protein|uniref:Uncharacterized protein n=1 Tax=Chishuiella changwenlii TaxID=1434701 RepID=A0A1M7D1X5_9FLAO|nr:hypothetical protein [Chishuiella changwenlii]GGF10688.1 hypothetical protein GCM10010984_29770 [Chishuiella changwenlii]SHL73496.1 hypothetical protein SAMN05443634_1177 [Chishuiella changwenlii]